MDSPWLRVLAGNFTAARRRTTGVAAWERARGVASNGSSGFDVTFLRKDEREFAFLQLYIYIIRVEEINI